MKRILIVILFPVLHVSAIAQFTAGQVARVEQTSTQHPAEPHGEAGESSSHVSLTPSTSQRIIQPDKTTLAINSLNGALNADLFPGEDIGQKINAAIDALPGSCGEIYIPAGVYAWHTTVIKSPCVKIHGAGLPLF